MPMLEAQDIAVSNGSLQGMSSSLHQNRPKPQNEPILKELRVRARVLAKC